MSLLPPNASPFETAIEDAVTTHAVPVPLRSLWDPQTCPESLLPWLAWSVSVDNWDATWPVEVRRAVVANAIRVQRNKGSVASVRTAIAAFGANMALREWWQNSPHGTRGTFDVVLSIADQAGAAPTAQFVDSVIAEIDRTKPLSRHFTFAQALTAAGNVGLIGCIRPVIYARADCTA